MLVHDGLLCIAFCPDVCQKLIHILANIAISNMKPGQGILFLKDDEKKVASNSMMAIANCTLGV